MQHRRCTNAHDNQPQLKQVKIVLHLDHVRICHCWFSWANWSTRAKEGDSSKGYTIFSNISLFGDITVALPAASMQALSLTLFKNLILHLDSVPWLAIQSKTNQYVTPLTLRGVTADHQATPRSSVPAKSRRLQLCNHPFYSLRPYHPKDELRFLGSVIVRRCICLFVFWNVFMSAKLAEADLPVVSVKLER